MNCQCNIFIYSLVTSQHLLNKPLTKREIHKRVSVVSQLLFWLVEILLRMYIVYCQCIYTHIQQFNRKMIILQGFKLLQWETVPFALMGFILFLVFYKKFQDKY